MENDSYLTIATPSEGLFKDKGSKFLSFAFPVENEEQIRNIIETIRKKYHDARHHCYAWRLGVNKLHFRVNDDGEPSNSAGKPILGQIQSYDLTNILIIVVRYFGGTLLGVGGLIQAYRQSASDALENAEICKKYVHISCTLKFPYSGLNMVMKLLKDMNLDQWDQKFELVCELKVKVRKSEFNRLYDAFQNNDSFEINILNEL